MSSVPYNLKALLNVFVLPLLSELVFLIVEASAVMGLCEIFYLSIKKEVSF